jgi:hypothetical protein
MHYNVSKFDPFIYSILIPFRRAGKMKVKMYIQAYTKNGAVSKVNRNVIFHPTWAQHTLSGVGTVHILHALPAVRFSCLLHGCGTSFQNGVAAREGFLCTLF